MTTQTLKTVNSLKGDAAAKKAAQVSAFDAYDNDPSDANGQAAVDAHNEFEQSSAALIAGFGLSFPK